MSTVYASCVINADPELGMESAGFGYEQLPVGEYSPPIGDAYLRYTGNAVVGLMPGTSSVLELEPSSFSGGYVVDTTGWQANAWTYGRLNPPTAGYHYIANLETKFVVPFPPVGNITVYAKADSISNAEIEQRGGGGGYAMISPSGEGYIVQAAFNVLLETEHGATVTIHLVGDGEEPGEQTEFWTGFIGAREVLGVAPPSPQPPDEPDLPGSPIVVSSLPYSTTLGALSSGTATWFKVTVGAGTYTFKTTDSPSPAYDTYLALFNANGNVVATNEDADAGADDWRSRITSTLEAGTYYVALGGFEGSAGSGFTFGAGSTSLPAGTVFKIETA